MRAGRPIAMPAGEQSLSRETLHGAMWSLLSQAVTALVALIVFVIMSRMVSHGELGEYMLAVVGMGAVQWLALNAYREPMIQAPTMTPDTHDSVFWFSAGMAT